MVEKNVQKVSSRNQVGHLLHQEPHRDLFVEYREARFKCSLELKCRYKVQLFQLQPLRNVVQL